MDRIRTGSIHTGGMPDILDEILKKLIALGKGIEINTAGFQYGLGHRIPRRMSYGVTASWAVRSSLSARTDMRRSVSPMILRRCREFCGKRDSGIIRCFGSAGGNLSRFRRRVFVKYGKVWKSCKTYSCEIAEILEINLRNSNNKKIKIQGRKSFFCTC